MSNRQRVTTGLSRSLGKGFAKIILVSIVIHFYIFFLYLLAVIGFIVVVAYVIGVTVYKEHPSIDDMLNDIPGISRPNKLDDYDNDYEKINQ